MAVRTEQSQLSWEHCMHLGMHPGMHPGMHIGIWPHKLFSVNSSSEVNWFLTSVKGTEIRTSVPILIR